MRTFGREFLPVLVVAIVISAILYFSIHPAFSLDETFYMNSAKAVLDGKDYTGWIIPPLFTYMLAAFYFLLGQQEYAARLASLIFYILSVVTMYFLARKLFDNKTSAIAALLLATVPAFILLSQRVMTETAYVFFWIAALFFFIKAANENKKWLLLSAIFFASGFSLKFSTVLLIPIFLFYALLKNKIKEFVTSPYSYCSIFLSLLILIPMFLYSSQLFGNYIELFVKSFQAYSSATSMEPPLFYPASFFLISAALTPLLLYALIMAAKFKDRILIWALAAVAFLILYRTAFLQVREIRYLIDIIPFIALLSAAAFHELFKKYDRKVIFLILLLTAVNVFGGIYLVNSFANNEKYVGMLKAGQWAKDSCSSPIVANVVGPAAYYTGFEVLHMNKETLKQNVSCFIYSKYEVVFDELEKRKPDFQSANVFVFKNKIA